MEFFLNVAFLVIIKSLKPKYTIDFKGFSGACRNFITHWQLRLALVTYHMWLKTITLIFYTEFKNILNISSQTKLNWQSSSLENVTLHISFWGTYSHFVFQGLWEQEHTINKNRLLNLQLALNTIGKMKLMVINAYKNQSWT